MKRYSQIRERQAKANRAKREFEEFAQIAPLDACQGKKYDAVFSNRAFRRLFASKAARMPAYAEAIQSRTRAPLLRKETK